MSRFLGKVNRRLKMTIKQFRSDSQFSVYYACLRVFHELGGRLHFRRLSDWAFGEKNRWISTYLEQRLKPVLECYKEDNDQGEYFPNAPVWVCWWSGEDTAPALVRQCIQSILRYAGTHPVYLITKDNFKDYLDIPVYMLAKVQGGQLGLAHLADYIRVSLLAEHGGLWLDATIFCSAQLPAWYFQLPVFTCKSELREGKYISAYRWVTFCLGGWKGNVFYRFLKDALEEYWRAESHAIDYLFFDHVIYLAYKHIDAIHQLLDQIPINNIHRDDLQAAMNALLPAEDFSRVIQPDTTLYKLSWREAYSMQTQDGKESIYAGFLKAEI